MRPKYIDIHTHTREIYTNTISLQSYRLGVDSLSEIDVNSPFTIGVHPWDCDLVSEDDTLTILNNQNGMSAIGEIGLDYNCDVDRIVQREFFDVQLEVCSQRDMPAVIHNVKAMNDTLHMLKLRTYRSVIHSFIGSVQDARRALDLDCYLSFGDRSLRSNKSVEVMRYIPLNRMFLESDINQGGVESMYWSAIEVLGVDMDKLIRELYQNYIEFFRCKIG